MKKVRIGKISCRTLDEFPDYAFSRAGYVYSRYKKPGWRKLSSSRIKNNGYAIVSIRDREGNKYTYHIHQLIAMAWVKNPEHKPFVGHKDNIRTNNRADNLYWCTASENTAQCIRDGRFYKPPTKASKKEIKEIRKLRFENNLSYYRLSKLYGYSIMTIRRYCSNGDS